MQRKTIAYVVMGIGVWIAFVTALHFAEKAGYSSAIFSGGGSIVLIALCVALYFLPAIVASRRTVKNSTGIVLLNVLLGWTGLGWIAALIWAFSAETTAEAHSKQLDYHKLAAAMRAPAPPPPPTA